MGCYNCDRDRHHYHDHHKRRHDCDSCAPGYYPPRGPYPPRHPRRYNREYNYERTDNIYIIDPPRFFR